MNAPVQIPEMTSSNSGKLVTVPLRIKGEIKNPMAMPIYGQQKNHVCLPS